MAERVCAVIVTYNRKELLKECLRSVFAQTSPPDHVLVVDNASTDNTYEMLISEFPKAEILRLPENQGGAGGFHEGMKRAYELGYEWIWIMDDDAFPERDCLATLLNYTDKADVLIPLLLDDMGRLYGPMYWRWGPRTHLVDGVEIYPTQLFSFVGPLFNRKVLEIVGLPRKDFFIWADDIEWSLRVQKCKLKVVAVRNAKIKHAYAQYTVKVVRLGRSSLRSPQPSWKYYYGTRNSWVLLNTFPIPRRWIEKIFFIGRNLRWIAGDILYETNWRERTKYRLKGFVDGLLGNMGRRV